MPMRIAVSGAGWYGCHIALALKKAGYDVVLFEKKSEILSEISGKFGTRLHAGPHYPRSRATRENCLQGLEEFKNTYPELVIDHEYAVYALGTTDFDGHPSKVDQVQFEAVCKESPSCKILNQEEMDQQYTNLISAAKIDEPSIALGKRLRTFFDKKLKDAGVEVRTNFEVKKLSNKPEQGKYERHKKIINDDPALEFDKVINATSYQHLVPETIDFPIDMQVMYQPCIALIYKDKKPGPKPISFIVMDGFFPCLMPITDDETPYKKYILTHGKMTIMGAHSDPAKAWKELGKVEEDMITSAIRPISEEDMHRFWPGFSERFEYIGWQGTVLAKLYTRREFRSALTYEKDNVIHIFPGKVSNVFDVEREVHALLLNEGIITLNDYSFMQGGVLDKARNEIVEKPTKTELNTGNVRTFEELLQHNYFPKPGTPQRPAKPPTPKIPTPTPTPAPNIDNPNFILKSLIAIAAKLAELALSILLFSLEGIKQQFAEIIQENYSMYHFFKNPLSDLKPQALTFEEDGVSESRTPNNNSSEQVSGVGV